MAANPLWRALRIHGELKALGITISERTVSRILRSLPRPASQTWKTFLYNHIGQMLSIDFFTVPIISMKVLFDSSSATRTADTATRCGAPDLVHPR